MSKREERDRGRVCERDQRKWGREKDWERERLGESDSFMTFTKLKINICHEF